MKREQALLASRKKLEAEQSVHSEEQRRLKVFAEGLVNSDTRIRQTKADLQHTISTICL